MRTFLSRAALALGFACVSVSSACSLTLETVARLDGSHVQVDGSVFDATADRAPPLDTGNGQDAGMPEVVALDTRSADAPAPDAIAVDVPFAEAISFDAFTDVSVVEAGRSDVGVDAVRDVVAEAATDSGFACPSPQTNCSGICVDTSSSPVNCGGCGNVCPTPVGGLAGCASGACRASCGSGATLCGSVCCAPHPNAGTHCSASSCVYMCNSGFADCDGVGDNGCEANLAADMNNCGGCGIRCPTGAACCGGRCSLTNVDPSNCGRCGNMCSSVCIVPSGGTAPICATGAPPLCGAGQTACGLVCVALGTLGNCTGCGQACPVGYVCAGPTVGCTLP